MDVTGANEFAFEIRAAEWWGPVRVLGSLGGKALGSLGGASTFTVAI